MTGLQRTLDFIDGKPVDRPPCHPIVMRWAARYGGIRYREFCLDYRQKCDAMIRCADDFDLDWVTVMSDAYCEASAFGLEIEYPEDDLPIDRGGHLADLAAARRLRPFEILAHSRPVNRINEIREFKRRVGERYFVVGWVEGPVAEYADLRGVSNAAMDFLDDPDSVMKAMNVIVECALDLIIRASVRESQEQAGGRCIVSAGCEITPDTTRQNFQALRASAVQ